MTKNTVKSETGLGIFLWKFFAYLIMAVFAFLAIGPIIWLFINSFKATVEFQSNMVGLPQHFYPQNYSGAWKIGNFSILFGNSILYTVLSVGIALFLSLLTGFAFAKLPFKATKPIFSTFLLGILITTQTLMVPIFLQVTQVDSLLGGFFQKLGLCNAEKFHLFYNTKFGVILIYVGSLLPIGVYLCTEYIKSIPTALVEAARIDGAGYFRIFIAIIVPMTVPIIITLCLLNIPTIWNEFALINILVSRLELQSLPLGIYKFSGTLSSDYGKQFAALVIGLLPMLVFYIIFRKQITRSVGSGAVKG
ncbi:carbohydrate ABC transporter permease [uncultured Sphaerochaeta sp.]|uniref:carbohydrate ABC transporter permease n=1 Tax=uncultured Sphaerochaeta sp. TaxID=886478 RepID=UPI002A0A9562|nr:carbohydrate ABC transporter permease [uncultured Sphaerochaeta sp.]